MKLSRLIIPILLATLGICSEYLPELFKAIPYDKVVDSAGYVYEVNYKDAVWFFTYGLLILVSLIAVLISRKKGDIAGKVLMTGPVFWFSIELYEKFCFLAKINNNRLFINDGSIWQIFSMLFIMGLAWYGLTKFKS